MISSGSASDPVAAAALDASLRHLDWIAVCEALLRRLRSPAAVAVLSEAGPAAIAPMMGTADAAAELHAAVRATGDLFVRHTELGGVLGQCEPLPPLRASQGAAPSLELSEVWACAQTAAAVAAVFRAWARDENPDRAHRNPKSEAEARAARADHGAMVGRLALLEIPPPAVERLTSALERDQEGNVRLCDGASARLRSARQQARAAREAALVIARRLLRAPNIAPELSDAFATERNGRWAIPLRAGALGQRVSGTVLGTSGSGRTVFVEPAALRDANDRLQSAHFECAAAEREVLDELSETVACYVDELIAGARGAIELDRLAACAALGGDLKGHVPDLVAAEPGAALDLEGARHPLMVLDGAEVVANDLRVACGQALIVSGPNAGGKTVALKTVGLCLLLARAGIPLPTARPACVPVWSVLCTDVGDDQSIAANLSTFTAHIGHVGRSLDAARNHGSEVLVLFDEIAAGTEPEQGAVLAEAVLRELVERGASVIATTHYERLKYLAQDSDRFENAAVGFDLERMAPTFRVHLGRPGASSALEVAARVGLDPVVIERARAGLDDERLSVDALLRDLHAEREALGEARAELEQQREKSRRFARELEAREQNVLGQAKRKKRAAYDAARDELRGLASDIDGLRRRLRKGRSPGDSDALAAAKAAEQELRARIGEHQEEEVPALGKAPETLATGTKVQVVALGAVGVVLEVRGRKAVVEVGGARTTASLDGLREIPAEGTAPSSNSSARHGRARSKGGAARKDGGMGAARHFGADPIPVKSSFDAEVDLRGTRALDCADEVERAIDLALQRNVDVVVLRHGHGGGALRKLVREHLRTLPYVRKHRGGLVQEGGEAVTVVWIEV